VLLVGAVATALAVAGLAPAGAKQKTDRWSGSCSFPGTVFFKPPAKDAEQALSVLYTGTGKCSGTLNGKVLSDATVKIRHTANSFGGCNGAHTTKTGRGTLTFPDGTPIHYLLNFTSMGTEVTFTYHGLTDGDGHGSGTFLNPRTPPDIAVRCATEGVPEAPLDVTLETDSTFISTRTIRDGNAGKGKRKPRLRLAVKPRHPDAGEQTKFKFRVRTRKGAPVKGATVRFTGQRVRTGRRGRARMAATLDRGKHRARATKRGYRSARRVVRAR
jgi:hypothetical protein